MAVKTREKRKRAYIRKDEKIAAALVRLLPLHEQRSLRHAKGPASTVLKLFNFDHGALHGLGGSDKWWNLYPMQVKLHREKSRGDTKIVAKVDRIIAREKKHEEARRRVLKPERVGGKEIFAMAKSAFRNPWPKRKIPSRPFKSLAK